MLTNLIAEGDLVLFDRNNHKAAHQGALMMGGAIPIYLSTDRNAYGLIGPIRPEDLDETSIRERIRDNPLVSDKEAWKRERPFRAAVIEQCTYDGTIYDAERIVERIGHLCDYIMFDEAWAGFMKFHPLYERRFAMGLRNLSEASPGIVATQSAHKQLASFSQASQIHVRDRHIKGQRRRVEHRRFNEGFMQFASTSPFYPLFASLDVGAQMMKGRSGEVLWDDTIRLGIELRKKLRAVRREFEEKERDPARRWFFDPFVPQRVSIRDAALEGGPTMCRGRTCRPTSSPATRAIGRLRQASPGTDSRRSSRASPSPIRPSSPCSRPASIARPEPMRITAFPRRWSRNTCARIAWWRRRTISIRCSSC